jgi:uncharacterized membrane protein
MSAREESSVEAGNTALALERIVFFSDAVMAIAITLLAIELPLPDLGGGVTMAEFDAAMTRLQPKLISFLISFLLIAIYWMRHLRVYRYIERWDATLLFLNLLFLLSIALLPFTSNLVGLYAQFAITDAIYALDAAAVGLSMNAIWWYAASRHRLIDEALPAAAIRQVSASGYGAPVSFLLSIPVAFVNPQWAQIVWWILPATSTVLLSRVAERRG